MDRRLAKLEIVYRRTEQRPPPFRREDAPDWRAVPWQDPALFAAMTEAEKTEWGELMTRYHEPGAYARHKDDWAFLARLTELDRKVDMRAGLPRVWPVR